MKKTALILAECLLASGVLSDAASAQTVQVAGSAILYDGSAVSIVWKYPAVSPAGNAAPNVTAGISITYYSVATVNKKTVATELFSQGISRGTLNPPSGKLLWTPRLLAAQYERCRFQATWYGHGDGGAEILTNVMTSALFEVVSAHGVPKLTLSLPTKPITQARGQTLWIPWTSANLPAGAMIVFGLEGATAQASFMEVGISSDTGGCLWTVPQSVAPGEYFLNAYYVTADGIFGTSSQSVPLILE